MLFLLIDYPAQSFLSSSHQSAYSHKPKKKANADFHDSKLEQFIEGCTAADLMRNELLMRFE